MKRHLQEGHTVMTQRVFFVTVQDTMYFLFILAMLFGGFALALYTLAPQGEARG